MKYMKLGTKPDTFYTEEAVRSVVSDIPADLIIHVNNTKYQLHKVTWSYTYTRPGYTKKPHQSVPKDWWTEDISELDIEVFRSVISTVRAARLLPPPLIGEALHVYACKHLPDPLRRGGGGGGAAAAANGGLHAQSSSAATEDLAMQRRVLETIVTMIPGDAGSVTGRFLLRLLRVANYVGASSSMRAQLIRQAGSQLDEATATDLLIPLPSDQQAYDVGAAEAVLEHFLAQFQRPAPSDERRRMSAAMEKVVRIFDEYLQTIALDHDFAVGKFITLAECLPDIARNDHDGLYYAIDAYLKEHPELSKADKKRLCRKIDCRKLSPDVRAQAISNDRMPLRTIVQLLFVEQERAIGGGGGGAGGSHGVAVPDRASVDAARNKEDEPAAADHKSDMHRARGDHAERARAEGVAMTRSLSASKKAAATAARKERTAVDRGSRLRDK